MPPPIRWKWGLRGWTLSDRVCEPRGPPLTLALLVHRPRRRCLAPLHRERCWGPLARQKREATCMPPPIHWKLGLRGCALGQSLVKVSLPTDLLSLTVGAFFGQSMQSTHLQTLRSAATNTDTCRLTKSYLSVESTGCSLPVFAS